MWMAGYIVAVLVMLVVKLIPRVPKAYSCISSRRTTGWEYGMTRCCLRYRCGGQIWALMYGGFSLLCFQNANEPAYLAEYNLPIALDPPLMAYNPENASSTEAWDNMHRHVSRNSVTHKIMGS